MYLLPVVLEKLFIESPSLLHLMYRCVSCRDVSHVEMCLMYHVEMCIMSHLSCRDVPYVEMCLMYHVEMCLM